ncbi:hypothetical protein B4N89_02485 [Embleya scabrispora]|uniref:YqaJ viral recombinase domain-containing protein n=1 Tax=Embleya scabrispora TaxID=159449 RepID=A0A1T3NT59_9ACTN|nr:YqaJ viral recombinase family protein [Embleya scabrispora]OPC79964.1 hypothetical protein B4N89_02485 [Embleya scabrispora]
MTATLVTPTGRLVLDADADRETWLDARRAGLGSSDIPAVLRVGYKKKSPLRLYYDKRGLLPHDTEFSEPAHFGTIFEQPLALDWARRKRTVVERVGLIANTSEPWMLATLDRLCRECPDNREQRSLCALEVKCRNAFVAKLWRKGPPDDVLAQTLWQILVTGLDHVHVMCLIGGNDPRLYTVRRADHAQLVEYIQREAAALWHDHIQAGHPPAASEDDDPDGLVELYQRLHPDRSGVVRLDRDLDAQDVVGDYLDAVAAKAAAERNRKRALARMLATLGGAQAAVVNDNLYYSVESSSKEHVDMDVLREFPDAWAACVTDRPQDRINIPQSVRREHVA